MIDQHIIEMEEVNGRIAAVEKRLGERTESDPVVQKLLTMAGIGPVTAWTMRAIIGRFDRFKNGKQLARFCALTPKNSSSGQRQADAGLIKAGDPCLKYVLIQAAQRLRRHEPRWEALYQQLRANGKPVCLSIAAVANRWVRWLQHELVGVHQAA
jgi:transposase